VPETLGESLEAEPGQAQAGTQLEPLVRAWLMNLPVLGRSPKTIKWYRQKVDWYLRHGGAQSVEGLSSYEFKRHVAELQARGLAPTTSTGASRQ
jgi:hypothetical protein